MSILAVGLSLTAAALITRTALKVINRTSLPLPPGVSKFNYYPRGGFERQMTKREAAKILSVQEYASKEKIREAHRRIMMLNHPDRGGSPFVATKINEAKDVLCKDKFD